MIAGAMLSYALAAALAVSSVAHAAAVGYARATSQLKADSRPTLYQPLNLLDGRDVSVWCEGADGDGVGEGVHFGFKGPAHIDEIAVANGDGKERATFEGHNRAVKLVISEETSKTTLQLVDRREPQQFKLAKPIEAERVFVEIAEVQKGTGDDNATCLADIVFYSRGKPLNGPFLVEKLKYDRGRARLMNSWHGGPLGAPERFLDFYFDGTYRFLYRPYDPDLKKIDWRGDYAIEGGKLSLQIPGKGWVEARATFKTETLDDGQAHETLTIVSEPLKASVGARYVGAP